MPLILGTNSIKDTGYDVANSCRFEDGDGVQLRKTPSDGGNQDVFTLSMWFKRGNLGIAARLFTSKAGVNDRFEIFFGTDDTLTILGNDGGSATLNLVTTQVFRDCSAWYHFCLAVDTGQAVAANRAKVYINGTQVSAFGTETYPSEDGNIGINTSSFPVRIGEEDATGVDFDGYMAEIVFLDSTQAAITSFGEFDEDSPTIWRPIDVSDLSGSKGTNGFYLDFEDSANLGNDAFSGTDFTEANLAAVDQAIDTPTNNFCVMNPLYYRYQGPSAPTRTATTLSQGNCKSVHSDGGGTTPGWGTIMLNHGKWYFEMKAVIVNYLYIGTWQTMGAWTNPGLYDGLSGVNTYRPSDGQTNDENVGLASYGDSYANNDIIGCAFNCDTGTIWFSKNGTWQNSATQGEVVAGTTTNAAFTGKAYSTNGVVPIVTGYYGASVEANFGGCSAFAITSGNADDNGLGNFEYDVPTGYYSICTKNLAEFGG